MKHFNEYNDLYTPVDRELANEIARKLNDLAALSQFLQFTKTVPHELLRQFLDNACAIPEHEVRVTRAAIFVSRVNTYKKYGTHGYTRD